MNYLWPMNYCLTDVDCVVFVLLILLLQHLLLVNRSLIAI